MIFREYIQCFIEDNTYTILFDKVISHRLVMLKRSLEMLYEINLFATRVCLKSFFVQSAGIYIINNSWQLSISFTLIWKLCAKVPIRWWVIPMHLYEVNYLFTDWIHWDEGKFPNPILHILKYKCGVNLDHLNPSGITWLWLWCITLELLRKLVCKIFLSMIDKVQFD